MTFPSRYCDHEMMRMAESNHRGRHQNSHVISPEVTSSALSPSTSAHQHYHRFSAPPTGAGAPVCADDIAIIEQLLWQTQRMHSPPLAAANLSPSRTESVITNRRAPIVPKDENEEVDIEGGGSDLTIDETAKTPPALGGLAATMEADDGNAEQAFHTSTTVRPYNFMSEYVKGLKKRHRSRPYR